MTVSNPSSFLDIALHGSSELGINGLLDGKKNTSKWQAAKLIAQMEADKNCPVPNALAATFFAQALKKRDGSEVHSFVVLGLIQDMMNKVCWVARGYQDRVAKAQKIADAIGKDYSQEADEEVGVDSADRFDIKAVVDSDYATLLMVQSDCVCTLPDHIDWQALSYFTQSEPNPDGSGKWITTVQALDFDDACVAMDAVVEKLNEEQEAKRTQQLNSVVTKEYGSQPTGVMSTPKPPAQAPKGTDTTVEQELARHTDTVAEFDDEDIPFGDTRTA